MGGRYWISGVQIGVLSTAIGTHDRGLIRSANDVLKKIVEEQFIGNAQGFKEIMKGRSWVIVCKKKRRAGGNNV